MMWFIFAVAFLNALAYLGIWWVWRKDCEEIGKDDLAVPLNERFLILFAYLTLPSILGLIKAIA